MFGFVIIIAQYTNNIKTMKQVELHFKQKKQKQNG